LPCLPVDTILSVMTNRFYLKSFLVFWIALGVLSASGARADAGYPVQITFQTDEINKMPQGWRARAGDPATVYSVQSEGGRRYMRAAADGVAVQIGYDRPWALKEYPVLEWQWRAVKFPDNSDERKKVAADSVLGLYVAFGQWPFIKSIKYVWSDTIPEGETFNSPFYSSAKIIVIRSGRAQAGSWVTERRDVLADYQRLFKDRQPPVARGIAILTDADNTRSLAIGDYAEIRVAEK
jgi:hypothetical protein